MAKKKSASRADAVRDAVDQAFKAQIPRERISDLLDEIGNTAGRLRGAVDELRPASEAELKSLRADIQALSARVAALEAKPKPAPRRRSARRPKPAHEDAAAKPAAGRRQEAPRGRLAGVLAHRRGGHTMAAEFSGPEGVSHGHGSRLHAHERRPRHGSELRDADVPQRFEFDDVDMVVNIRAAEEGEDGCLHWQWNDDISWKPKVKMSMSSEAANKYFQGKENVAVAIARRRIKTSGDVKAALALIPITKPVYAQYREVVDAEYPHLKV